jgi:hypothetical protein
MPKRAIAIGPLCWAEYFQVAAVDDLPCEKYDCVVTTRPFVESVVATGGTCVLVVDNLYESEPTLFKYCSCYQNVYVYKPESDDPSSTRAFVVALHYFREIDTSLNYDIPIYFSTKFQEMITIFGQSQLEYLRHLDVPKGKSEEWKSKFEHLEKKNILLLQNGPTNYIQSSHGNHIRSLSIRPSLFVDA